MRVQWEVKKYTCFIIRVPQFCALIIETAYIDFNNGLKCRNINMWLIQGFFLFEFILQKSAFNTHQNFKLICF